MTTFEIISSALQSLTVIGFLLAALQIRAAREQSRSTVLMKMIDEWNDPDLYDSVRYIHGLRREWKSKAPNQANWAVLVDDWVTANTPTPGSRSSDQWLQRRRVAQFLDKLGYMLRAKYLKPADVFAIAPEATRLLMVIVPLEKAIARKFNNQEPAFAEWDRPSSKLYLKELALHFPTWFQKTGRHLTPESGV